MKVFALAVSLLSGNAMADTNSEFATSLLVSGRCEAALEPLNAGIKAGEARAYFLAGLMYHKGYCFKEEPARAIPLLEVAARHGESDAAEQLILIHGLGRGVPQSFAQAGRWAIAAGDIVRLKAARLAASAAAESASAPGDGRPLNEASTAAYGQAATIHARARELFELDWRSRFPSEMAFSLIATTMPSTAVEFEVVDTDRGSAIRGMERRRLVEAQLVRLQNAYAAALAEVPKLLTEARPLLRREYYVQIR